MGMVRQTDQGYWYWPELPYLELRSSYYSSVAYKAHSHHTFSIGGVFQGVTVTQYDGQAQQISPGELVLLAPQQVHSCNPLPGQVRSYHMLYIDQQWCLTMLTQLYKRPITGFHCQQLRVVKPELFAHYLAIIELLHAQQLIEVKQQLTLFLQYILSDYCQPVIGLTSHPVTDYIRQQFAQQLCDPPSLAMLASQLQLREESLVRVFKRITGITPHAFLNNLRIEQAKKLIRNGSSLADVAYQTGFSDQSHFHKTFVNYVAATPKQYQQARSIFDKT